ncbi:MULTISPECIES: 16S rRNA (guanine(966)-N(2))-methyltransferase RsmD [Halocynthiibacter]|uniref:16S rRNA (Guanine(966)-N(2))-methyltransferase RsmD n=1 Tax=Halocynthiibacter halioticoli TaxID=2986804 RepID=A0AAE3LUU5_9RHOB|nr:MULTISPECIES: 16S rRNA (guanine(966)-N(2))-methyltransferase RsmD [Halocynthiibacter]MCV6825885.1 16S rRNA (guanine(966)-N(2))-methyltransferase RsmD [Halocynthiibacter halioticoli]MCW4058886.1 16S rRNA (guanine(966)-N(2))-methyltransferase RsmD [Halocynthiibacter sp. SDUM655004]
MRIIAGANRGLKLVDVGGGDIEARLRPTSDRVRESLFNVLNGGAFERPIENANVLDLFAGTGALGLEALSRGARFASFVDNGRVSQKLLRENIRLARRQDQTRVLKCEASSLPEAQEPCSLVFLDPPYGQDLGGAALVSAAAKGWLAEDALIVWEESKPVLAPNGFQRIDTRKYGGTHITFLRYGG